MAAIVASAAIWLAAGLQAAGSTPRTSTDATNAASKQAVFEKYCFSCHNPKVRAGQLVLTTADITRVGENAATWEKVIRKLRLRTMPPAGVPRPDVSTYDSVAGWLENEIDQSAIARPNPGRTETFHRLNRTEYHNAIRDLLEVDIDVTSMLPSDDAIDGFDNVGDVLTVSPALLEGYMTAAKRISRLAVGFPLPTPTLKTYSTERIVQDGQASEDLPLGSRGGFAVSHYFPADGEYAIKLTLQRTFYDYIRGIGRAHLLDVRVDGALVKRFSIGGHAPGQPAPAGWTGNISGDAEWENYLLHADTGLVVRVPVRAGTRKVGVSFVDESTVHDDVFFLPELHTVGKNTDELLDGDPAIESIAVSGPEGPVTAGETASRRRIFVCQPTRAEEAACAEKILSTIARRAYRRPLRGDDVKELLNAYMQGTRDGGFEAGVQFAVERILADPEFLFRIEREPASVAPGQNYRVSDLELASRLSFFLWSSLPDDELLGLAARGRLSERPVLEAQVRRMLVDPRSQSMVDNFVAQWLDLRALDDLSPDRRLLPDFDEDLRDAFKRETQLFVASQIRDDRSVLELWRANYTFVNERLAKHYQIPNIYGINFRKVILPPDSKRGGLLGQGSVLMLTSYPNRTSPVLRGKWLLSNVLGTPPPPPPPNVPKLEESSTSHPTSLRERLEQHRRNAVCATCHSQMDPLGFALEHFDAIGGWRAKDGTTAIDDTAVAASGENFEGLDGLRTFLLQRDRQVVATLTQKLLAYALGRAVEYYDVSSVRRIVQAAASNDYRWSALILGVVRTPAFQMRQARAEPNRFAGLSPQIQH
jgi:mono/diheme cytochrome c family protein